MKAVWPRPVRETWWWRDHGVKSTVSDEKLRSFSLFISFFSFHFFLFVSRTNSFSLPERGRTRILGHTSKPIEYGVISPSSRCISPWYECGLKKRSWYYSYYLWMHQVRLLYRGGPKLRPNPCGPRRESTQESRQYHDDHSDRIGDEKHRNGVIEWLQLDECDAWMKPSSHNTWPYAQYARGGKKRGCSHTTSPN